MDIASVVASGIEPEPLLGDDERKARYGVVYLRALASQAGCTVDETAPGEDVQAIDAKLGFGAGDVFVQVKTTHQHELRGTSKIGYTAKPRWLKKWKKLKVPAYFVVVVVPADSGTWLTHDNAGTSMKDTAAYWTRIDTDALEERGRVTVDRSARLQAGTFAEWETDLMKCFGA